MYFLYSFTFLISVMVSLVDNAWLSFSKWPSSFFTAYGIQFLYLQYMICGTGKFPLGYFPGKLQVVHPFLIKINLHEFFSLSVVPVSAYFLSTVPIMSSQC
jgi:hypothetical protein